MVAAQSVRSRSNRRNRIAATANGEIQPDDHDEDGDEAVEDVDSALDAEVEDEPAAEAGSVESDYPPSMTLPESLPELAKAIVASHRQHGRCHEQANAAALRTGELLAAAKERVGRGLWTAWCSANLKICERQVERYLAIFRDRRKLDKLNPEWSRQWTLSEALDRLAEARASERAMRPADRHVPPDLNAHPAAPPPAEPLPPTPRRLEKLLSEAEATHRQHLKELQQLRDDGDLDFRSGSTELAALSDLSERLVVCARQVAAKLLSGSGAAAVHANRYAEETVAMGLADALLRTANVADLFAPSREGILASTRRGDH